MKIKCVTFFIFLVVCLQLTSLTALAQEISDKELEQMKKQKDLAVLKKDIAEAELAELKARFPDPKTTPLEGKTTVGDTAVIENLAIAHVAMAAAANKMAAAIKEGRTITVLVIYNQNELNNLLSYRSAKSQVKILKDNYCEILNPAVTNGVCPATGPMSVLPQVAAIQVARSFLGGFVDTLALLRTNVEVKGALYDIEEGALVSEVFRALRSSDRRLYYPAVYPPAVQITDESQFLGIVEEIRHLRILTESILEQLTKVQQDLKKNDTDTKTAKNSKGALETEKANVVDELTRLRKVGRPTGAERLRMAELETREKAIDKEIAALETKIAELQGAVPGLMKAQDDLVKMLKNVSATTKDIDDATAKLKTYNLQFDQFVAALVQVNQTGSNLLTGYIRAENLDLLMSCKTKPMTVKDKLGDDMSKPDSKTEGVCSAYWLQLKVLKAGGNNRIKTNLIVDVFTGGNRISHSGGAIVQYHLFDNSGESVLSDTISVYTGYVKSKKVQDLGYADIDVLP